MPILTSKEFRDYIESRYKIAGTEMLQQQLSEEELNEEFENASEV
jgi:hypothetical protein